jgi:hypothetical protein
LSFDPWNHSLKFRKSTRTPSPKVGVALRVWGFTPSHFPTLPGVCDVILDLSLGPHPCNPFWFGHEPKARVATKKLMENLTHISSWINFKKLQKLMLSMTFSDALPSPKLCPIWALVSKTTELWGLEGMFPSLNTKRGRRACWSSRMGLRRGTSFNYLLEPTSNQPTSWLVRILETFGARTSHEQFWTHKTYHGLDSGETITFPHIVLFALLRGTHIRMAFCPETFKEESQKCPGLDSRDLVSS